MSAADGNHRACLHLVVGAEPDSLAECLRYAGPEDTLLFLDVGVLHLLAGSTGAVGEPVAVCFAESDLAAHGLRDLARHGGIDVVDDAAICDLLMAHRHCLTWP